ncbi:hypothetical protein FIBSPDRAFT_1052534 [Athelia psychrophila]|uniref:Uncharacterized protein n=1 Tax=Athelia psychrophila TaxID=1759441 RepID=A0A165X4L1_9AGAM|nr:hypothetical protein FIBSPDRAFT_1052534 [Fibularhizoctonia sp. CBS 109695]
MSNSAAASIICAYEGAPPMNTDISGVGVRISFYLQTLFLGFQAARSGSGDDITGAEYTLIATNIAMASTQTHYPPLSFSNAHFGSALVVLYLLTLCWVTNICLLASCGSIKQDVRILQLLSVLQSIVVFAFALAVLITAHTFGSNPECNTHAKLVFLRPFRVFDAGRIVGGVTCGIVLVLYICMTARDYLYPLFISIKQKKAGGILPPDGVTTAPLQAGMPAHIPKSNLPSDIQDTSDANLEAYAKLKSRGEDQMSELNFDGTLTLQLLAILILWALAVMNTELLIVRNRFASSEGPQSMWQFGQVLPLLLIIVPFVGMIKTFNANGLRKVVKKGKETKKEM